jgi:hypothetical protein
MRLVLATALLCTAAAPAMAQSRDQSAAVAQALKNPMVQEAVAATMSNFAGIVLDTRVGPLAHYADPRDDIRPNDTLRDIERRRDPAFEKRLHDDTRRAVAGAGMLADDVLTMSASLQETANRLRAALEPLRKAAEAQRDRREDRGGN